VDKPVLGQNLHGSKISSGDGLDLNVLLTITRRTILVRVVIEVVWGLLGLLELIVRAQLT
jgi:hypothetical protein